MTNSDEDWWNLAKCRGFANPDFFFPNTTYETQIVKRYCLDCPVREECLEEALAHYGYGVWGGLSTKERNRLKASRPVVQRQVHITKMVINTSRNKSIRIIETGKEFNSQKEVARFLQVHDSLVSRSISVGTPIKGYHLERI